MINVTLNVFVTQYWRLWRSVSFTCIKIKSQLNWIKKLERAF